MVYTSRSQLRARMVVRQSGKRNQKKNTPWTRMNLSTPTTNSCHRFFLKSLPQSLTYSAIYIRLLKNLWPALRDRFRCCCVTLDQDSWQHHLFVYSWQHHRRHRRRRRRRHNHNHNHRHHQPGLHWTSSTCWYSRTNMLP